MLELRAHSHVNKKQDDTIKSQTNDNKVSGKLYDFDKIVLIHWIPLKLLAGKD